MDPAGSSKVTAKQTNASELAMVVNPNSTPEEKLVFDLFSESFVQDATSFHIGNAVVGKINHEQLVS